MMTEEQLITAIEEAIPKCSGNLSRVADLLGITRARVASRVEKTPRLAFALAETKDRMLDSVEEAIQGKAKDGDVSAGKLVLTTIGKERGYVPRQEHVGRDGEGLFSGAREELETTLAKYAASDSKSN